MTNHIKLEKADNAAWITLDRAEVKNAISRDMVFALLEIFENLKTDTATRVVVIQGRGADFSAGGDMNDIAQMLDGTPQARTALTESRVRESAAAFAAYAALPQPVIVGVRGWAIGAAFQLALGADFVIASETARLSAPNVKLAHAPDHGETYFLPRKVGLARALQIGLLGEPLGAAEAEKFGIVNWVVPDAELDQRVLDLARRFQTGASVAVAHTKALLLGSLDRDLAGQFEAEREACVTLTQTHDFGEAIRSFHEKRKPVFIGS